jgi:glycerol kinase
VGPALAQRPVAVVAIDAGTTGVRTLVFDSAGVVVTSAYRELTQYYPHPGWVEHDAGEIWDLVEATLVEAVSEARQRGYGIAALGITNQRETAVAWDRNTGVPLHRAIVWQDRRTAARCGRLRDEGRLPLVRARTGLVLDPYFSATKWAYMLEEGGVSAARLALSTVDSWLIWNLAGGAAAGTFVTDVTNASRTLCLDIGERAWSGELCEIFGVPREALPEVRASSGRLAVVAGGVAGGTLAGVPISGVAGDQQAALFGQACFAPGETKVTYGTGTFVLANIGATIPPPVEGLLTTVAWELPADAGPPAGCTYALEGAIFSSGAAIQWLRDGLGLIRESSEIGPLAASVPGNEGCYLVPAFTGLGSPWWDPYARGTVIGLTRGVGRAHLARAVVEAIAYQTRDVVDAMGTEGGRTVTTLYADGGAAVIDILLQLQADQLRLPVVRRKSLEVTALGAALLAGLAEGVWADLEEIAGLASNDAVFNPIAGKAKADGDYRGWLRALERSRAWVGQG